MCNKTVNIVFLTIPLTFQVDILLVYECISNSDIIWLQIVFHFHPDFLDLQACYIPVITLEQFLNLNEV
jgi:hypothetical protein